MERGTTAIEGGTTTTMEGGQLAGREIDQLVLSPAPIEQDWTNFVSSKLTRSPLPLNAVFLCVRIC